MNKWIPTGLEHVELQISTRKFDRSTRIILFVDYSSVIFNKYSVHLKLEVQSLCFIISLKVQSISANKIGILVQ